MVRSAWDPDDTVCAECIGDHFFKEFIQKNAPWDECSYCNRSADGPIALDVDAIVDRIKEGLQWEWEDAAESVPYVSKEGGYLTETYHTSEVLMEVGFYAGNDALHDKIVRSLPDYAWVKKDWQVGSRDEVLRHSWEEFSRLVKHRHRYLFFPGDRERSAHSPTTPPAEMLDEVGAMIRERNLLTEIPSGIDLLRVRIDDDGARYTALDELCSAPTDDVRSPNRMSPAGVSAFYASLDAETPLAETDDGRRPTTASIGTFRTNAPIPVVDFVDLPAVPSHFVDDWERRNQRPVLIFLRSFVRSLTRPVTKDGRQHIDYVPSQVVTEYLRDRFKGGDGTSPAGIKYPSAQRGGGESVVLFYTHDDFTSDWLPPNQMRPPLDLVDIMHRQLD